MDSTVRWLTAFLDVPDPSHDAASAFWASALSGSLGPTRGDRGQFATLEPAEGDACVRLQRFDDGPRVHLDLHVDEPDVARRHAESLGATHLADHGFHIMRTPAGFVFCLVHHRGEGARPAPAAEPHPLALDTLCLDVAAADFESELRFWVAMFGLGWRAGDPPEFARVHVPQTMPFGLLVQQLGADDPGPARAHFDLHCEAGTEEAVAEAHIAQGATRVGRFDGWIVMRDPADLLYCLVTGPVNNPPWSQPRPT